MLTMAEADPELEGVFCVTYDILFTPFPLLLSIFNSILEWS